MKHVGSRHRPIDWQDRTSGKLKYSGDLGEPRMLEAAILRSPYPLARIKSIDTTRASRMDGVWAIITAADFPPGVRYIHEGAYDRPPLADGIVRFVGQEIAAVAADSEALAYEALSRIEVTYEMLSAPLNTHSALSDSWRLHRRSGDLHNISFRVNRSWGVKPELARPIVTVGGNFKFARQAHACMEPSTTVAKWDDGSQRLHLWTATQAPYYVVREVAHTLGLKPGQVVCHEVAIGGGFGARSKICEHEAIVALLARLTKATVRIRFTRAEEFEATKTRHGFATAARLHVDASGRFLGIDASVDADNGAYNHSGISVLNSGVKALAMVYRLDWLEAEGRLIDTASIPGGSFRGFGSTQTSFALECLVDEAAYATGIDPIEIRRRNAFISGDVTLAGAELKSARLIECLDAVETAIDWKSKRALNKSGIGLGIAAGVHISGAYTEPGSNRSDAAIDIFADGHIRLRFGGADSGTGQKTILAQIVAEELGLTLDSIEVVTMDSDLTPFDMGSWSSRGTHFGGHAVRKCAIEAGHRLREIASLKLGQGLIRLHDGMLSSDNRTLSIAETVRLSNDMVNGALTVQTSFIDTSIGPPDTRTGQGNISPSYNFAAHAAEIDVDERTGQVTLLNYVAAHDIGTAINPTLVEGQIVGGTVMGLGAALGEELIYEQGKLANASYLHYSLPRSGDVPKVRAILVQGGDPLGPYGAKGVGECGINPPAAAVANAVYAAIGVRVRELPITPDKIINALAERDNRQRRFALWRRPSRWWIAIVRWAYPRGLFKILHKLGPPAISARELGRIDSVARPSTFKEAVSNVDRDFTIVAGGTDVAPRRRQKLLKSTHLLSLSRVRELKGVRVLRNGDIEIGSMTPLTVAADALRSSVPIVADAIQTIASAQIREMATIGGNLLQAKRCWFYRSGFSCFKRLGGLAPCYAINGDHRFYHSVVDGHRCQATTPSDLATIFHLLDAVAVVASHKSERSVPFEEFYLGPGETVLTDGEFLTQIRIPARATGLATAYKKLRLWEGDFAVVSAAIATEFDEAGYWRRPRITFGAIAPVPWRAVDTEIKLAGRNVTKTMLVDALNIEFNAKAHPLAGNGWKLDAAVGLAEQAFEEIMNACPCRNLSGISACETDLTA